MVTNGTFESRRLPFLDLIRRITVKAPQAPSEELLDEGGNTIPAQAQASVLSDGLRPPQPPLQSTVLRKSPTWQLLNRGAGAYSNVYHLTGNIQQSIENLSVLIFPSGTAAN